MEHCKKLVLMSHDAVAKLTEKPTLRTTSDVMSDLDTAMDKIMKQKAEDSEKWKMYEQTLQRYLHFAGEQRKPIEFSSPAPEIGEVKTEKEEEISRDLSSKDKDLLHQLELLMPVKLRGNGSALFHFVASPRHRSVISWDVNGQVAISGKIIGGSSIIDLISDASRPRQAAIAYGWSEFAAILKKINAPHELVQNKEYKNFINSQRGDGLLRNTDVAKQPQHAFGENGRKRAARVEFDSTVSSKTRLL